MSLVRKILSGIVLFVIGLLLLILITVSVVLSIDATEQWIADKAATLLSDELKTEIRVQKLDIRLWKGEVELQNVIFEDQLGDTLFYVGHLKVNASYTALLSKTIKAESIYIDRAQTNIYQLENNDFNIDFLGGNSDTTNKEPSFGWLIQVGSGQVRDIKFQYRDSTVTLLCTNQNLSFSGNVDVDQRAIDLGDISLNSPFMELSQKSKPRPDQGGMSSEPSDTLIPDVGWSFKNTNLKIEDGDFLLDLNGGASKQIPGHFSFQNMAFQNTQIELENLDWEGSSIAANLLKVAFKEQSGFQLDHLQSQVLLSEKQINLEGFNFQTPYSDVNLSGNASYPSPRYFYELSPETELSLDLSQVQVGLEDLSYFIDSLPVTKVPPYQLTGKINGNTAKMQLSDLNLEIGKNTYLKLDGVVQNFLTIENINWQVENADIAIYKNDLGAVLDQFLPETEIFYYDHYKLKTTAGGSLDSLKLDQFVLNAAQKIHLNAQGQYVHSKAAEARKGDLKLDLRQTHPEAFRAFIKENKWISALGKNRLKANISLANAELIADLKITNKAGQVDLNGNATINEQFLPQKYAVTINSNDFQLSVLPISKKLEQTDLEISIEGKGLHPDTLDAQANILIADLIYNKHKWRKIELNSQWKNKKLQSEISVSDSVAALQANAFWSRGDDLDSVNLSWRLDSLLTATLDTAFNFKINTDGALSYAGNFKNLHHAYLKIDTVEMANAERTFKETGITAKFDQADSNSSKAEIKSDFIAAKWNGPQTESWSYLPEIFISALDKYFPFSTLTGFEKQAQEAASFERNIEFNLALTHIERWLPFFVSDVQPPDSLNIDLSWQPADSLLQLNVNAPYFKYRDYGLKKFQVAVSGQGRELNFLLALDSIFVGSSVYIPDLDFTIDVYSDTMFSQFQILNDSAQSLLSLNNQFINQHDDFRLYFQDPFILNKKEWLVQNNSYIYLGQDSFKLEPLTLAMDDQKIRLENKIKDQLTLRFEEFQIGEITELISFDEPDLEGRLNGSTRLNFEPTFRLNTDLRMKDLRIDRYDAGALAIKVEMGDTAVQALVKLTGEAGNIDINGNYMFESQELKARGQILNFAVKYVAVFLPEYVDSSSGSISTNFTVDGTLNKPVLKGTVDLNEIRSFVKPTQTFYTLNSKGIEFDASSFQVSELSLKDRYGATGQISGTVKHNYFETFDLDLQMQAQKFTFFEIPKDKTEPFSGTLRLDLEAQIGGTLERPNIELNAKTRETTDLLVSLIDQQQAVTSEDYVFYYDPEKVDTAEDISVRKKMMADELALTLRMNLQTTDDARMRLIIDPVSGDYLDIRGNSNLGVDIQPDEVPQITGTYEVKSGAYRFSYEKVLKKKFDILEGSKINFSGDPMDARLDVQAKYTTQTTTYELIESQSTGLSEAEEDAARKKTEVNVLLNVAGVLSNPVLNFNIKIPGGTSNLVANAVSRRLVQLRQDESELNKQVFSLLLFNSFISEGGGGGDIGSTGEAAALSSVSKLINNQLNKLAQKHVKAVDISFAFDAYKDKFSPTDKTVAEMGLNLSKDFLDDRLSIQLGGNLNLEDEAGEEETQTLRKLNNEFVIEYKLTENGRYSVKVFQAANYDLINNNNVYRTGAGISFSETFGKVIKEGKETKDKTDKKEEEENAEE